uniref:Uncharacterized protein n=1 Tax=Arundo donax TaxID=35708 RepID=A0A0A9EWH2_ARUDO
MRSAAFAFQRMMMVQSSANSPVVTTFIVLVLISGCTSTPYAPCASTMFVKTPAAVAVKKYKPPCENTEHSYPSFGFHGW